MKRETFARQVREALAHLHNRLYLESLPLATCLGEGGRPLAGDELRRLLIEAIERLRPAQSTPATLADWRRYRHLVLRYAEGRSRAEIARELQVSARQATRDHEQAIEELVAAFWCRRNERGRVATTEASPSAIAQIAPEATGSTGALVTAEAAIERADVRATIEGVLATLKKLRTDRRVRVNLALPAVLPAVAVDPGLFRQALLHLLSYAVRVAEGKPVTVIGADTSQGISLRVEIPVSPSGGRGDCGSIGSREEVDDLFRVGCDLLATQGIPVVREVAGPRKEELAIVFPPAGYPTVLVVDDNPDLVGLFRRYLQGKSYRLVQATNGPSALRIAREIQPVLIILDVLIPSQDGWEILHDLRGDATLCEIPVVVCSVLPERTLARELGVADFLLKPVSRTALLEVLGRWCPEPAARPIPL